MIDAYRQDLASHVPDIMSNRKEKEYSGKPGDVVSHEIKQSPEEVLKYWDKERMRNAKPIPLEVKRPELVAMDGKTGDAKGDALKCHGGGEEAIQAVLPTKSSLEGSDEN